MFENLSDRLESAMKKIKGYGTFRSRRQLSSS